MADCTWKVGSQAGKSPFSSNYPDSSKAKHIFHVLYHTRLTTPEQPQQHLVFNKSAETLNNTSFCQSALIRTTFEELSVVQTGTQLRLSICRSRLTPDATRKGQNQGLQVGKGCCYMMPCTQSLCTALVKALPGRWTIGK